MLHPQNQAEALLECGKAIGAVPADAGGPAAPGAMGAGSPAAATGGSEGIDGGPTMLAALAGDSALLQELMGELAAATAAQLSPGAADSSSAMPPAPALQPEQRVGWWPMGSAHVPAARRIRSEHELLNTRRELWHAIGLLLP
jgi:hypothetical protein